ncbi:oligosaccharide flippase family protein [Enterococcus sp. AZ163]|uniref:oligosaccharide flippase family protein n=1 Tax=Enterococcus sp. AZ163 TaxID=2774638 RepID=UPI003D29959A
MNTNRRIAKNTFFLYILTLSNYFLGLLLYPFLSRVLSVEKFGLIGFSMSFILIFQMIVEYGFNISTTADISKLRLNTKKVNEIVTSVIWSKILLSGISIFIFAFISLLLPMIGNNILIVGLFLIDSIIKAMLPDFYFRGIEEMKTITIRAVIAKFLCILLAIIFVHSDKQIVLIPISFIIGDSMALIITFIMMFKNGVRISKPNFSEICKMLREGFLFFISRLSVSINNSVGSFFLGLSFSPASVELGILAGITKITTAGEMMLTPISDSIYPHMVKEKDYKLLKKIFIYGGIVWLVGCSIVFLGANTVCSIILGAKYSSAGDYLRILMVNSFFAFFSIFLGYPSLSPIGKANYANAAIPVATIINVLACLMLWIFNAITLVRILVIMSLMNIILVIIRGSAFYKYRYLIPKK